MPEPDLARRPLWAGRVMALLGIVLVAFTLRTAVGAISPIVVQIDRDVPLSAIDLGILGAVPPVFFALSALVTARIAKRVGLERLLVLAILSMIVGHLLRAFAPGFAVLLVGTCLALLGAGFGNVLLPPLVKRYFPDAIGLVTSLYATLLAFSAGISALVAAPIADSAGWRASLGLWAIVSGVSLVPWFAVLLEHRRERARLTAADEAPELDESPHPFVRSIWRSPTAWRIALILAVSAFNMYAMFAWLPQLAVDTMGVTHLQAGALLALASIAGAPAALIMPILTVRLKRVSILVYLGVAFFVIADLGIIFAPTAAPVLWVLCAGLGPLIFPVCLTLINLRTRTPQGSVALSGFVQAVGYAFGALGPLLVGVLHDATGGWLAPLLLLLATALSCIVLGLRVSRPVFLEDELAAR